VVYPGAVLGAGDPKASGAYISGLVNKTMPATVFKNSILTWVYVKDVAEGIIRAAEKQNNTGERYIIAKHQVSLKDINKIVSEVAGVSLPLVNMPDFLVLPGSFLLTGVSNLIKKPPVWGMSVDQMRTMKSGFRVDGSKAEKELGITYTPIRTAIEEHIAAMRN
jgi:dihydroflavonol-4-reductase